jgi:8-oxo-dGTP pyrophosphatase MutT (NUDIX family)
MNAQSKIIKGGITMKSSVFIVKAIIVKYSKFLVLVRRKDGRFDLPGGKLEEGEGVCQGLVREVSEESGLVFERPAPINRWSLPTCKGTSTGMTFCCDYKQGSVVISHEHTSYYWLDLKNIHRFTPWIWVHGFRGFMVFDRVYPQNQFEEEMSDIKNTVNIECAYCKPEGTFSGNYIFKDFPENYLERQIPAESGIMFPRRIP